MDPAHATSSAPARGLDLLRRQVLDPGLCVVCGGCLGLCPHLALFDGQVAAPDACGLDQGRCYDICPQAAEPDADAKRARLLKAQGREFTLPLGPVLGAWWGRGLDPDLIARAQYGGVVSTLMALALEQGLVGEAVLTQAGAKGTPEGVRALTRQDVIAAAGSIYAGGGALGLMNQA
ncbi:MAG: hypothetical protein C0405_10725, partial [Desulfovibrio sp.]|nr:hypothetical protein [Desulfovibrio sp.]